MADFKACIPGIEKMGFVPLPAQFSYALPASTEGKESPLSLAVPATPATLARVPSALADDLCIADEGASQFFVKTERIPALADFLSPFNTPLALTRYVQHRLAYPSFAAYLEKELLTGTRDFTGLLEAPPPTIAFTPDTAEWTVSSSAFGHEEIAFLRVLVRDGSGEASDFRLMADPFDDNANPDRFLVAFSNRFDENDVDMMLAGTRGLATDAAPLMLRVRVAKIVSELTDLKQRWRNRIAQPRPIRPDDRIFQSAEDPKATHAAWERNLADAPKQDADPGHLYEVFKEPLFPEEVAYIRAFLKDEGNELFVEQRTGGTTTGSRQPHSYAIEFFADIDELDTLFATIESLDTSLGFMDRSRLASLRRECQRLRALQERWTTRWVETPIAIVGGAVVAGYFFTKFMERSNRQQLEKMQLDASPEKLLMGGATSEEKKPSTNAVEEILRSFSESPKTRGLFLGLSKSELENLALDLHHEWTALSVAERARVFEKSPSLVGILPVDWVVEQAASRANGAFAEGKDAISSKERHPEDRPDKDTRGKDTKPGAGGKK